MNRLSITLVTALSFATVPVSAGDLIKVASENGKPAASDRIVLGAIGIGGRGSGVLAPAGGISLRGWIDVRHTLLPLIISLTLRRMPTSLLPWRREYRIGSTPPMITSSEAAFGAPSNDINRCTSSA